MISYQKNIPLQASEVASVFDSSGIKRPTNDLVRIQKMFDHADLTISAWDEDKLIGVCRALTDFSYCCYLSDLAVAAPYQKQGIGQAMINYLKKEIGEEVTLILLSAPKAITYYPKIGFEPIHNGFIIHRAH